MSVRLGNNIIAGRSSQPSLFDFKWADHILNDPQWIRADTNSWQYKVAYDAAYDHLEADIQDKEAQSETIEGIIITYYLANDGHKICLPDQIEYIDALYNTTGIAWYYIIDTINKRFKVPRTKWSFEGIKDGGAVGTYTKPGLPNIKGALLGDGYDGMASIFWNSSGSLTSTYVNVTPTVAQYRASTGAQKASQITLDASKSSSVYGNSLTVQPRATQMYLYFFMGSFTQTALVNGKLDLDLANISSASKIAIISLLIPDFARAQTVSMPFTATTYGWFIAHAVNVTTTVYVNSVSVAQGNWASGAWSGNLNCQILVSPGDVVTGATGTMRFIPCKGA